jgi:hypothetical protein
MIEVYIRHTGQTFEEARFLADWPVGELDALLETVQKWGVSFDGEDYATATGGFIMTPVRARFEILIGE